jgi:hypothetical protein
MEDGDEIEIIFEIHDKAKIKEGIQTELRIEEPTLLEIEQIFVIRNDLILDEQFPSTLQIKEADILLLDVELVRSNPETVKYDYNVIRISKPQLDETFNSSLSLNKPVSLIVGESYNINPLARIKLYNQSLSYNEPAIENIQVSVITKNPEVLEVKSSYSINKDGQLMDISNSVKNVGEDNLYTIKLLPESFTYTVPTLSTQFSEGNRTNTCIEYWFIFSVFHFAVPSLLTIESEFDKKFQSTENCHQLNVPSVSIKKEPLLVETNSDFDTQKIETMRFKEIIQSFKITFFKLKIISSIFIKNIPTLAEVENIFTKPEPKILEHPTSFIKLDPVILDFGSEFVINKTALQEEEE